jgi:NADPH:quinone reductase-like Zn-dependent oxidoreductase
MDYEHAAAIPEVFVTAHEAMIHLGRLQPGESVLIHAAAGGVGSSAVQLASALGARVFATTEAAKLDRVHALGTDVGIDYQTQDFANVVQEQTEGKGVDVIVDFIGAPYFERNLASLNYGGRLVQVGIMGGAAGASIALDKVLYRHLQIIGTVMKSRTQDVKHAMVRRFRDRWLEHLGSGHLNPVLDSVFPLSAAADAHRRMESSQSIGKIILSMEDVA